MRIPGFRYLFIIALIFGLHNLEAISGEKSETVSYYRLRLDFSTTSNGSAIEIRNADHILSIVTLETIGNIDSYGVHTDRIVLKQSRSSAEAGSSIGLVAELALDVKATGESLEFIVYKSPVNTSKVIITDVSNGSNRIIKEIVHKGTKRDPKENVVTFNVDLADLHDVPPETANLRRLDIEKMTWAFYYGWYNPEWWARPIYKDFPLQRYTSSDPAVIKTHIEQAKSAGIDGFIFSYWGKYTDGMVKTMLDIAQQRDFKVCVYLELLASALKTGEEIDTDKVYERLKYMIKKFRTYPAYMHLDGRPVIPVYQSAAVPRSQWAEIFSRLRAENLDAYYLAEGNDIKDLIVFDGLVEFSGFKLDDYREQFSKTSRLLRHFPIFQQSAPKLWAPAINPGYDDQLLPSRVGQFRDRDNGKFYRNSFKAAVNSNPDWILVASWNEWPEHTYIEPSELYGDKYLRITQDLVEKWKAEN